MAAFTIQSGKNVVETDAASVEIGTRSSCTVYLRDPVASAQHARITRDPNGFEAEDLGSATGTWRNGVELRGKERLANGDVLVVGCTRVVVALDAAGAALRLEVQEQGFFFEPSRAHKGEAGAMQVGGDAERWVRDEVTFGRWRALGLLNKLAVAVALVFLAALAVPWSRGDLLEPGPLAAAHAWNFGRTPTADTPEWMRACLETANEQGCSACHDTLGGTSATKCAQCHATLVAQNHPFHGDRSATAATAGIVLDDDVCASCHLDHSGAEPAAGVFIPKPEDLAASCARCHESGAPTAGVVARQPERFEPVAHELVYDRFPHDRHADQRCDVCHQRDTDDGAFGAAAFGRDFAKVSFVRCMDCHSADEKPTKENAWGRDPALASHAAQVKPEHQVRLAWHGSQGGSFDASHCLDCHKEVHAKELRTTKVEEKSTLAFALQRRAHTDRFAPGETVPDAQGRERGCVECHPSGSPLRAGETIDGRFWHETHLATVRPDAAASDDVSAQCAACHADTAQSEHLTASASWTGPALASCAECHWEQTGATREALVLAAKPSGETTTRERIDFPHAPHVRGMAASRPEDPLGDGCFACHGFAAGERAFQSTPTTHAEAMNCIACHYDHTNVGGPSSEGCALCHPDDAQGAADPVWYGQKSVRMRADTPGFSHWSRGHAKDTDANACATCHGGVEKAKLVGDVPIPSEADASCFDCHVRERFHWRGAPAVTAR